MITKEKVRHIGWLSRIDISEEEADAYAEQMNSVLDYFGQLDEADTQDIAPTYHIVDITNVFRKDEVQASMLPEDVLANTEHKEENNFKTPRIM